MNKKAFSTCFKESFHASNAFMIDWCNHFGGDITMPSVVAYKAQLKLRGIYI